MIEAATGPDWQALGEQVKGFLESLAGLVGPNQEQADVAEQHRVLSFAMGNLPRLQLPLTYNGTREVLEVSNPPPDAVRAVVRAKKTVDVEFDSGSPEIKVPGVKRIDIAIVEFYNVKGALIAFGRLVD